MKKVKDRTELNRLYWELRRIRENIFHHIKDYPDDELKESFLKDLDKEEDFVLMKILKQKALLKPGVN